jgi:hypothetical protein
MEGCRYKVDFSSKMEGVRVQEQKKRLEELAERISQVMVRL